MPSFDVVSEIDRHEVANAVDQANREVSTRFDFKGTDSSFTLTDRTIALKTESEFQLDQMLDMLYGKLSKRSVDLASAEPDEPVIMAKTATRNVVIREGMARGELRDDLNPEVVQSVLYHSLRGVITGALPITDPLRFARLLETTMLLLYSGLAKREAP